MRGVRGGVQPSLSSVCWVPLCSVHTVPRLRSPELLDDSGLSTAGKEMQIVHLVEAQGYIKITHHGVPQH